LQFAIRPYGAEVVLVAADPVEAALLGIGHGVDVGVVQLLAALGLKQAVADRPLLRRLGELGPGHQVEVGEFHRFTVIPYVAPPAQARSLGGYGFRPSLAALARPE
jgi:hypothetical protein